MVDEVITKQELIDAKLDAASLELFISGTDTEEVLTRLGRTYPTLAKAIRELMETGGWKAYTTEAELLATVPTVNPSVAYAFDTKKMYRWDGTAWVNEGLSQLDQAKEYTDIEAGEATIKAQASVFGTYENLASNLGDGYISKTDGAVVNNSVWKNTGFIMLASGARLKKFGTLVGSGSSAAAAAFYDKDKNFLGVYTDTTANFDIEPLTLYPEAKFVRLSIQASAVSTTIINVYANNPFIKDFFKSSDAVNGYITLTGAFTPFETWITTPLVAVTQGQKLTYSGRGNVALVSSVSAFDKNGKFLRSLYASSVQSNFEVIINDPDIAYIRASSATAYVYSLVGFYVPESKSKKYSTIVPMEVYALKNEPIYLYADGIVGNADNVAWNISESNYRVCKITPTTDTATPVTIQTTEDDNAKKTLASFNVVVTDTPLNPSAKRYLIALGDSTTDGTANSSIAGAWPNECSRRLNGVGFQILPAELSPAPLAMTNLEFIGTRGDKVVKHEGRGGWRASHYLNNASVSSLTNAFWNPATSQFDMSYYLSQNGFTGVNSTGSNLTVVIQLGWNDVYKSNAKQAATDLSLLIDKIRSTHPNTDIICLGLNQAPETNFKSFTGNRFISKREVFESIKQFNDKFKAMTATKTNVDFLQISCVFNSEIGYNKSDFAISSRSTKTVEGVPDHVHPNATGYAMIADAIFYKLLYKYCR